MHIIQHLVVFYSFLKKKRNILEVFISDILYLKSFLCFLERQKSLFLISLFIFPIYRPTILTKLVTFDVTYGWASYISLYISHKNKEKKKENANPIYILTNVCSTTNIKNITYTNKKPYLCYLSYLKGWEYVLCTSDRKNHIEKSVRPFFSFGHSLINFPTCILIIPINIPLQFNKNIPQ